MLLFIPSFSWKVYVSLLKIIKNLDKDISIMTSTRTIIDKARNIALEECVKGWHDYLIFLDDDVIPNRPDFIQQLTQHKKDMCCWVYRLRQENNPPAVMRQEVVDWWITYHNYEPKELEQVSNAWAGLVAIRHDVCKQMLKQYHKPFEFKDCEYIWTGEQQKNGSEYVEFTAKHLLEKRIAITKDDKGNIRMMHRSIWEDMIFYERARQLGYELWCDPSVRGDHIQQDFIISHT